jgi:UDP-glucose 4,6-dehydratase
VGGSKVRSILQVARDLTSIWHDEQQPALRFVSDRAYNDQRYDISSDKLKSTLQWPGPSISWEQGLTQTVQWYVEHPRFWKNEELAIVAHPRLGVNDNVALL